MPSYAITGASRGIGHPQSAQPDNVVFGLVRNKSTATELLGLAQSASNIHVLQADITDSSALKFQVNVLGVIRTINVFLPLIRKGGLKKVLTLSSGMGDLDFARNVDVTNSGPYSVSKAALNMVVVKYAVRFKDEGIVFLTISPGIVDTFQGPPPPPAVLEELAVLRAQVKKFYPEWDGKSLESEESVRMQLQVLEKATIEDSGAFVSQHGNKQWV
ncbi:uncharacterized protein B0H18DRAFT_969866 [Fomitopsis serialis]|uniref:uncharacterized protein n=1 Tax=Fomitopsis serialis TaxID=139415 RepID=UPI00200829FB|nr:uncharacterized protein B0H18DRAFT_969866 [Neoantrodia serialis]KAH9937273.1 hypothetical protein B0H18DRAFT_969866 [Neoantrodia serialis]